ncbi:hypothetical protein [Sporosarcina sp. D27]|uniref:hypothetical protein n=1 Tax=Sporosarcina sp. D27 TaxID=1382305 RepID=UPI000472702D|nr:hypothetical protein [Sporosarcina sp. D27]
MIQFNGYDEILISANRAKLTKRIDQLGENRIAIIDTALDSGMRGEVIVLEFNETEKTFDLIGRYNYVDFFNNPQKYNQ